MLLLYSLSHAEPLLSSKKALIECQFVESGVQKTLINCRRLLPKAGTGHIAGESRGIYELLLVFYTLRPFSNKITLGQKNINLITIIFKTSNSYRQGAPKAREGKRPFNLFPMSDV